MRTALILQTYVASLVTFLLLDFAWLGVLARRLYRDQLGHLLTDNVRWPAAILFYLLFVAAVVVFVIIPGAERGSPLRTVLMGAFFGFVAYATYDLTNLAVMRGFPLPLAIVDMAWGALLTAAVSAVGYLFLTQT